MGEIVGRTGKTIAGTVICGSGSGVGVVCGIGVNVGYGAKVGRGGAWGACTPGSVQAVAAMMQMRRNSVFKVRSMGDLGVLDMGYEYYCGVPDPPGYLFPIRTVKPGTGEMPAFVDTPP